jgi:hypothetical protein
LSDEKLHAAAEVIENNGKRVRLQILGYPLLFPASGGFFEMKHSSPAFSQGQLRSIALRIFALSILALLMWLLVEELNPDWYGYQFIYTDGGAWLSSQGRDPAFILLNRIANTMLGSDGYDKFRIILGIWFLVFTSFLLRGKFIPFQSKLSISLPVIVAVLPLMIPRFTIQIREGLAITIILAALALLMKFEFPRQDGYSSALRPYCVPASICLAIIAYLTHSGTLIITLALVLAWALSAFTKNSKKSRQVTILCLALISFLTVCIGAVFLLFTATGARVVESSFGWLVDGLTPMTPSKWAYWVLYGLGISTLISKAVRAVDHGFEEVSRMTVLLISLVALPAVYLLTVILLASGIPAIVISALSRIINMLLSLLLLIVAFRTPIGIRLVAFSIFLLVDQARIISEALVTTFGDL